MKPESPLNAQNFVVINVIFPKVHFSVGLEGAISVHSHGCFVIWPCYAQFSRGIADIVSSSDSI